jgi:hypothetical protein
MPKLTSRREFFRLPYPVSTGATLAIDGTNYTVAEVSEGGLRLNCSGDNLAVAQRVQGTLVLTAGMKCTVTGTVLRIQDRCVILKLSRGPTGYDVLREQRHLTKTFPDWKPQPPDALMGIGPNPAFGANPHVMSLAFNRPSATLRAP